MAPAEGPDGSVYAVTIRWLPWEPKVRVRTSRFGLDALQFSFDGGIELAVFCGLLLLLLLIPLVLILLPVIVFVVEVAVLAVVVGALTAFRAISGEPWLVDVRNVQTGERTTFKVVGFRRAREVRGELVSALRRGPLKWPPEGATLA